MELRIPVVWTMFGIAVLDTRSVTGSQTTRPASVLTRMFFPSGAGRGG